MLTLLLGALTANLRENSGPRFYQGGDLASAVILSLLMALLAASAGMLISLRSATVRQAQQLISLIVIIPTLLPVLAFTGLSAFQRRDLLQTLSEAKLLQIAVPIAAVLLVVDGTLIAGAMQRFQRARLIVEAG